MRIANLFTSIFSSQITNPVVQDAIFEAVKVALLIVKKTTVTMNGQITFDPVNDLNFGRIQTGEQVTQDRDPLKGIEIRYFEYNGPTVYGGYSLLEYREILAPPNFSLGSNILPPAIPTFTPRPGTPLGRLRIHTAPLDIDFIQSTNIILTRPPKDANDPMIQIAILAHSLIRNPGARLTLVGNIGMGSVEGSGPLVPDFPVTTMGKVYTNLALSRAQAISDLLTTRFGINPNRITVLPGNFYFDSRGRIIDDYLW